MKLNDFGIVAAIALIGFFVMLNFSVEPKKEQPKEKIIIEQTQ
jgi:hypothetical protein